MPKASRGEKKWQDRTWGPKRAPHRGVEKTCADFPFFSGGSKPEVVLEHAELACPLGPDGRPHSWTPGYSQRAAISDLEPRPSVDLDAMAKKPSPGSVSPDPPHLNLILVLMSKSPLLQASFRYLHACRVCPSIMCAHSKPLDVSSESIESTMHRLTVFSTGANVSAMGGRLSSDMRRLCTDGHGSIDEPGKPCRWPSVAPPWTRL